MISLLQTIVILTIITEKTHLVYKINHFFFFKFDFKHETLAIAVNCVGGKSNSGEGGEDTVRGFDLADVDERGCSPSFSHLAGLKNGDSANSYIHQVASG